MLTESQRFACPHCGETNWVEMEPGDFGQRVIQDCAVCCRAIEILLPDHTDGFIQVFSADG